MENGKVWLVGAGPGDAGLLTIKGRQVLENAQVVVFDRLVGAAVLALCPKGAKLIDVGKNSGNHPVPQEGINQILVEQAQKGLRVVRLKGGDPFIFGRGGEEIEELIKHGISFEQVPGITSAVAALAYAGIPATHRDYASSVHIITAHKKKGSNQNVDFDSIAKAGGTLVFLMGISEIDNICQGLINAGMDKNMPVAFVEKGTDAFQRRIVSTLEKMPSYSKEQNVQSPAIIVVGKVVSLCEAFDWRKELPLTGVRAIVTRTRKQASRLSQMLYERGAQVIEAPAIEIEKDIDERLDECLEKIFEYKYLIFTSPNGVDCFMEHLRESGKDIRALGLIKIAAIGQGTADELKRYALIADFMPKAYNAKELGAGLCKLLNKGDKVLAVRAREGSLELNSELEKGGIILDDLRAYNTLEGGTNSHLVKQWLSEGEVYAILGSASCAKGFYNAAGKKNIENAKCICIGEQTAKAAKDAGLLNIFIAQKATLDSLIDCTIAAYNKN